MHGLVQFMKWKNERHTVPTYCTHLIITQFFLFLCPSADYIERILVSGVRCRFECNGGRKNGAIAQRNQINKLEEDEAHVGLDLYHPK